MVSTVRKLTFAPGLRAVADCSVWRGLLWVALVWIGTGAMALAHANQTLDGTIDFPLQAEADANGNLRWILLPPASPAQIDIADSDSRSALFDQTTTLITEKLSPQIQKSRPWTFQEMIQIFLASLGMVVSDRNRTVSFGVVQSERFNDIGEGVQSGAKDTLEVPVNVKLKGKPLSSLHLALAIGIPNVQFASTTLGPLGELATGHRLDDASLSADEAKTVLSIRNSVNLTSEELKILTPQLVQIALDAMAQAKSHGLAFGQLPPEFPAPDPQLSSRFRFPGAAAVTLFIAASSEPEFSHELTLSFLSVVRKLDIMSSNASYLAQANRLGDSIRSSLPQIWTAAFDRRLRRRLADDRRVTSLGERKLTNGVYQVTPQLGGALFQGQATATVGVQYSTAKQLTGSASVSVTNFTGKNEKLTLEAQLGDEVRNATLNMSLPIPSYRTYNGRLRTSLTSLNASYARDLEQRYALVEADQEVYRLGLGYHLIWDQLDDQQRSQWGLATAKNRKRWHLVTHGKVTVTYEDWNFLDQTPNSPPLLNGQYGVAALSLGKSVSIDLRRGQSWLHELEVPLRVTTRYGLDLSGDNPDYAQMEFSAQGRLYVGWRRDKDLTLSLSYRGGISENRTPIFKTFKIGEDNTVRGLESGELLARTYAVQSVEVGVSLCALLCPWLIDRHLKPGDPEPPLAQRLASINLKAFYDQGTLTEDASTSNLLRFDTDRQGYGIAFAIPIPFQGTTADLEIGYARSPDSKTHSSGLLFTRLVAASW